MACVVSSDGAAMVVDESGAVGEAGARPWVLMGARVDSGCVTAISRAVA